MSPNKIANGDARIVVMSMKLRIGQMKALQIAWFVMEEMMKLLRKYRDKKQDGKKRRLKSQKIFAHKNKKI